MKKFPSQVGNGVFLAAGAIVMGNIIVGDGAIINAGSVVTKPVREHTRVGGVPGREISEFAVDPTIVTDVAQRFKDELRTDFPKSFTDLRVK
jgi:serine O-acetyltransferase